SPARCRWRSGTSLKECIAMPRQRSPGRAARMAGWLFAATFALAAGYSAWADEPAAPHARAAAKQALVEGALGFDLGDEPGATVRVVHTLGEAFEIADDKPAWPWRATLVAQQNDDGSFTLDVEFRSRDRLLASPSLEVEPGQTFAIGIEGGKDDPAVHMEG